MYSLEPNHSLILKQHSVEASVTAESDGIHIVSRDGDLHPAWLVGNEKPKLLAAKHTTVSNAFI